MPVFYGNQLLDDDQIYLKLTDTTPLNSATFSGVQGQSVFAFDYVRGLIDVKLNGKRLKRSAYTATNGTSVTLATPIASNYDVLTIDGFIIEGSQNAAGNFLSYGGTANAITLTSNNAQPAKSYKDGAQYKFRATATNTGAATISVDGLPAKACKTITGAALPSGHIRTDMQSVATYYATGDSFVVVSDVGALADTNNAGAVTLSTVAQAIAGTPGVIPDAEQVRKNHVAQVATIADLRALGPAFEKQAVNLSSYHDIPAPMASSGGGVFIAKFGDYSTEVASDTLTGVYVAFPSDHTGASGAWVRKLEGFVTPEMFGAVGDGSADDAAAITKAVTAAISTGRRLVGRGTYRVDSQVNIRYANVDFESATINVNHSSGPGIIIGGNASNANNPRQMFGAVNRTAGSDSQATPTIRAIGLKGQYVGVQRTTYFQLYADDSAGVYGTDYSSAYSTLWLKYVNTIELLSAAGTTGWINENQFFLNRCFTILISDGLYTHNHNKFYNGTMEGTGVITVARGSSNFFNGFRFERNPSNPAETLTITFGDITWNNNIEATWQSSPGYVNDPYGLDLVIVNDSGTGNTVNHVQQEKSDEIRMLDLSSNTPFVSSINKNQSGGGGLNANTDIEGVRFVKHLINGKFKCLLSFGLVYDQVNQLIPVQLGDSFEFASDQTMFRPRVYLYDANRKWIRSEPSVVPLSMSSLSWDSGGFYTIVANVSSRDAMVIDTTEVKFIRFAITFGSSVTGNEFSYLRVTARQPRKLSRNLPRPIFSVNDSKRRPSLFYYNDSDIDMKEIGPNIPCFLHTMAAMKINLLRSRHYVAAKSGAVLTVDPTGQFPDATNCKVVYTDLTGAEVELSIASASGSTITLTANAPSDLAVGDPIVVLLTRTKTLT